MISSWLVRVSRQRLAPELRSELEQAALRVTIVGIVLVYLIIASLRDGVVADDERQVLWVAAGTFLFSLLLAARIGLAAGPSVSRRFVGMFADNAVTTYCLVQMDEAGAVIIGVYLFVTFGNGFRYGRVYLHASQVMALVGFGLVVALSSYWRSHPSLSSGVFLAILVLPFYVGVLTKRITEAKLRADAANQAKGRFLANVSHEMRTPLNGVIAMADVLRETTLTEPQREIVETMTTSAQLLLAQIEDVLDMAKIEAGRIRIEERPFDLSSLIASTVKVMSPQAHYKGLSIQTDISMDTRGSYVGDPHHLRQVLLNLLSNAVKFTSRGNVTVRTSQAVGEGATAGVMIEVQDTGIGIPEPKLQEIFEPFAQADDSITRVYGGTGLGTTIAKNLVTQMGGSIGVQSTEGVGSTFWIWLPLSATGTAVADSDSTSKAGSIEVARLSRATNARKIKGARILVAEDNATNQRVAQLILESGDHVVTTVSNGEEALDKLETEVFDLALFDLSMPVVSGIEALKLYLFSTPNPIPVLIASANVTNEAVADCMRAGAAEFISKPLRASVLLDSVERHLANVPLAHVEPPALAWASRPTFSVVDSPVLDREVLGELSKLSTDPTFVNRLIAGFCSDAERLRAEIVSALAGQYLTQVRDSAHALKGGCASIGALRLMQLAVRLEKASHQQLSTRSDSFVSELNKVCSQTVHELSRHIEARKLAN